MKITLVSFYKMTRPLNSGGLLRTYNLFKTSDVSMVGYGDKNSREKFSKTFVQQVIAKRMIHKLTEKTVYWLSKSNVSSYVVSSWFCKIDKPFIRALDKYAGRSDILIAEFPYQFSLISKYKNKLLIYDAHNTEGLLQKDILPDNLIGRILKERVNHIEQEACKRSDIIFTCSENDKKNICSLYRVPDKKIFVVPNGTDTKISYPVSDQKKRELKEESDLIGKNIVLFIGSDHKPNLEAIRFIVNDLAPKLPKKTFLIVGGAVKLFLDENSANERPEYKRTGYFHSSLRRFRLSE